MDCGLSGAAGEAPSSLEAPAGPAAPGATAAAPPCNGDAALPAAAAAAAAAPAALHEAPALVVSRLVAKAALLGCEVQRLKEGQAASAAALEGSRAKTQSLERDLAQQRAASRQQSQALQEEVNRLQAQLDSRSVAVQEQQRLVAHYRSEGEAILVAREGEAASLALQLHQVQSRLAEKESECSMLLGTNLPTSPSPRAQAQLSTQSGLVEALDEELSVLRKQLADLAPLLKDQQRAVEEHSKHVQRQMVAAQELTGALEQANSRQREAEKAAQRAEQAAQQLKAEKLQLMHRVHAASKALEAHEQDRVKWQAAQRSTQSESQQLVSALCKSEELLKQSYTLLKAQHAKVCQVKSSNDQLCAAVKEAEQGRRAAEVAWQAAEAGRAAAEAAAEEADYRCRAAEAARRSAVSVQRSAVSVAVAVATAARSKLLAAGGATAAAADAWLHEVLSSRATWPPRALEGEDVAVQLYAALAEGHAAARQAASPGGLQQQQQQQQRAAGGTGQAAPEPRTLGSADAAAGGAAAAARCGSPDSSASRSCQAAAAGGSAAATVAAAALGGLCGTPGPSPGRPCLAATVGGGGAAAVARSPDSYGPALPAVASAGWLEGAGTDATEADGLLLSLRRQCKRQRSSGLTPPPLHVSLGTPGRQITSGATLRHTHGSPPEHQRSSGLPSPPLPALLGPPQQLLLPVAQPAESSAMQLGDTPSSPKALAAAERAGPAGPAEAADGLPEPLVFPKPTGGAARRGPALGSGGGQALQAGGGPPAVAEVCCPLQSSEPPVVLVCTDQQQLGPTGAGSGCVAACPSNDVAQGGGASWASTLLMAANGGPGSGPFLAAACDAAAQSGQPAEGLLVMGGRAAAAAHAPCSPQPLAGQAAAAEPSDAGTMEQLQGSASRTVTGSKRTRPPELPGATDVVSACLEVDVDTGGGVAVVAGPGVASLFGQKAVRVTSALGGIFSAFDDEED